MDLRPEVDGDTAFGSENGGGGVPRADLPVLTSLRFPAALWVVLFHFGYLPIGWLAVTFFFILSGFILTYVYLEGDGLAKSDEAFWKARLARIAPAFYLALLL